MAGCRFRVVVVGLVLGLAAPACEEETTQPTPSPQAGTVEPTPEPYVDVKATAEALATPTPTAMPAVRDCPSGVNTRNACEVAIYVAEQVRMNAVDFLVSATRRIDVACDSNRMPLETLCSGVAPGERREGLIYANKLFQVLPEATYREHLSTRNFRDTELVGIACPRASTGTLDCSESFVVGLDPLPSEPNESPRYTALVVEWNSGAPVVIAHFDGLYSGLAPVRGGPNRLPVFGITEPIEVWWQPWRP